MNLNNEGGVMDIQKELESFKTVAIAKGWSIDGETTQTNYRFYSLTTNSGWEMWQASKAQAVPEGFVVFPKKQTSKMRSLARDFDARLSLTKYEQLHNIWVKQAIIESQEQ